MVLRRGKAGKPIEVNVRGTAKAIKVTIDADNVDREGVVRDIRHIFRLDEEFEGFYEAIEECSAVGWAAEVKAGRLLRGPNVFEDLVKTLCTRTRVFIAIR